jgi:hypothetical protein
MKPSLAALIGGAVSTAAAACTPTASTAPAAASGPTPPPDPVQDASAGGQAADALEELFRDGSPEDIAAKLEAMVSAPEAGPDATARPKPKPEVPVAPRPVYKGVSF